MASKAGGAWVTEQLSAYDNAHFIKPDGSLDLTTNTARISEIMRKNGFVQNGKKQIYKDLHVFPVEFFCPRQTTGEVLITKDTYCDHHFMGSWNEGKQNNWLLRLVGNKGAIKLIKLKRTLFG